MAGLNLERLGLAFPSRPDLVAEIQSNADSPARVKLFNNIANYICDLAPADGPALKRRRVEDADSAATRTNGNALPTRQVQSNESAAASKATDSLAAAAAETVLLEIKDVSVSIPQRKKYDLVITQNYLYARAANTAAPVPGIVYSWHDIEHVLYLPVPEKAQVQHNYVLMPRGAALASLTAPAKAAPAADAGSAKSTLPPPEPLVFTVPATAPKPGSVTGPSAGLAAAVSDSYKALLHWAIEGQLRSVSNAYVSSIVAADPKVFHSATRQPFRPQEKAVHVRAFRGSKDGYLFFLPTGILWAFKKPLLFIPLDRITAVSYTNVLQRTFNIVVEVDIGTGDGEEVEFGMIDQEDYGTISESYVQRHGLQDRSMAEQRKAKRELAENARGEAKEGADGEAGEDGDDSELAPAGGDDDGLTELQRAEQMLQDAEDEEEEDYDPGSDGDSDGSGSSDEEDEDGEGGGDDDGDEEDGEDDDEGEAMDAEE